ncbi:MAG: hypothetical protein ACRDQ7_25950 [Haloechinothrix sp.]
MAIDSWCGTTDKRPDERPGRPRIALGGTACAQARGFVDAAPEAIAEYGPEVITELAPVWQPRGSPMQMIDLAVRTHVRWMAEHPALYLYQTREELTDKLVNWAWLLISQTLRSGGAVLDPDKPLPPPDQIRAQRASFAP